MWRQNDGVVHLVSVPSDSAELEGLVEWLRSLTSEGAEQLDAKLLQLQWEIADELDALPYESDSELEFDSVRVPSELILGLDWEILLGSDMESQFRSIDLRWRLDVVGVVEQALADRVAD